MVLDAKGDRFELNEIAKIPQSFSELNINQTALDRITDEDDPGSEKLEKSIYKFIDIWTNQKILEVSFAVHNNAIDYVGLISNEGEQTSIPLSIFVKVFDGVSYFKKSNNTDPVGIKFEGSGEYIIPQTTNEMAESILSKVRIVDTIPNKDFSVYKGQFKESPMVL
jgi:hypothetical protein